MRSPPASCLATQPCVTHLTLAVCRVRAPRGHSIDRRHRRERRRRREHHRRRRELNNQRLHPPHGRCGSLEAALEQHWRRHGGQGGAGVRRPSPGRSAGGCGRPSAQAGCGGIFCARVAAFLRVSHTCAFARKFACSQYCCTCVQWAHVVFRARLGRPKPMVPNGTLHGGMLGSV